MSLITIRRFQLGYESYRHAINQKTDNIFLQRRVEGDNKAPWETLLRYDPNCSAWDADTGKRIGGFHVTDNVWRFKWADGDVTISEPDMTHEALLDFEVTISQQWLRQSNSTVF